MLYYAFSYCLLVTLEGKKWLWDSDIVTRDEPHHLHSSGRLVDVAQRRCRSDPINFFILLDQWSQAISWPTSVVSYYFYALVLTVLFLMYMSKHSSRFSLWINSLSHTQRDMCSWVLGIQDKHLKCISFMAWSAKSTGTAELEIATL